MGRIIGWPLTFLSPTSIDLFEAQSEAGGGVGPKENSIMSGGRRV